MRWKLTGTGSKSSSHMRTEQGSAHTAQQHTQNPKELSQARQPKAAQAVLPGDISPREGVWGWRNSPIPPPSLSPSHAGFGSRDLRGRDKLKPTKRGTVRLPPCEESLGEQGWWFYGRRTGGRLVVTSLAQHTGSSCLALWQLLLRRVWTEPVGGSYRQDTCTDSNVMHNHSSPLTARTVRGGGIANIHTRCDRHGHVRSHPDLSNNPMRQSLLFPEEWGS